MDATRANTRRRARLRTAIGSLLPLALVACASLEPREATVAGLLDLGAPDGQALYRQLCASCHGAGGTGDGPLADQLKVGLPDLTRLAADNGGTFPRATVREVLTGERPVATHGSLSMPVWGRRLAPVGSPAATAAALDEARDVTAILDYLASIQRAD